MNWLWFIIATILSSIFTIVVRKVATRAGILDRPEAAPERKLHSKPVPLLGGIAVFCGATLTIGIVLLTTPHVLLGGYLLPKHLLGMFLGGLLLMVGGFRDDLRSRSVRQQLLWPICAALVIIASGIGIAYVTNPLGGTLQLDTWKTTLFSVGSTPYNIVWIADAFGFAWLMVSMYATKLLDGLDGLVSGISVIGMVIIAAVSLSSRVGQPETAVLALVIAGSFFGFLLFNFHPAKIFLGEGGSLLAGFLLGTLAILSGGKIATALLVLGIPMIDILVVIALRFFRAKRSIVAADKQHIHHRFLSLGLSHRQTVLLLYLFTALFGSLSLLFSGKAKVAVLALIALGMIGFALAVAGRSRKAENVENPNLDRGA